MATKENEEKVMKEEEKKKGPENRVRITGYLRENNLTLNNDDKSISGDIVISTEEGNSYKVKFKTWPGFGSYDNIKSMLPENTVSLSDYFRENKGSSYNVACKNVSRVDVYASASEPTSVKDGKEKTYVNLSGNSIYFAKEEDEEHPFKPAAKFSIECYLESMEPSKDENGVEDGGLLVTAVFPTKLFKSRAKDLGLGEDRDSASRLTFVAHSPAVVSYLKSNYAPTDTVLLKGLLRKLQFKIKNSKASDFFGESDEPEYITRFVDEREILGGSKTAKKLGEEGAFTKEDIEHRLKVRTMDMTTPRTASTKAAKPKAEKPAKQAAESFSDNPDEEW